MPRESTPLKREFKGDITINIADIFRNPDMQKQAIKGCKKLKRVTTTQQTKKCKK